MRWFFYVVALTWALAIHNAHADPCCAPGDCVRLDGPTGLSFDSSNGANNPIIASVTAPAMDVKRIRVHFDVTHPNVNDIYIVLRTPEGVFGEVAAAFGLDGATGNYVDTIVDTYGDHERFEAAVPPFNDCYLATLSPWRALPLGQLCGEREAGAWQLLLFNEGADTGSLNTWALELCSDPEPACAAPVSNAAAVAIPDLGAIESTISMLDVQLIQNLNVSVSISHPSAGTLALTLIGPNGHSIKLRDADNAQGADYTDTTFAMQAAEEIQDVVPPFTGTFKPVGNLSFWNSEYLSNGEWQLRVEDTVAGGTGTINNWSLAICGKPVELGAAFQSTDVPFHTDVSSSLTYSELEISTDTVVTDLNLVMSMSSGWGEAARVSLISPSGTEVYITRSGMQVYEDWNAVRFDDDALRPFGDGIRTEYTGTTTWAGGDLCAFNGEPANGLWKLNLEPLGISTKLEAWSLEIVDADTSEGVEDGEGDIPEGEAEGASDGEGTEEGATDGHWADGEEGEFEGAEEGLGDGSVDGEGEVEGADVGEGEIEHHAADHNGDGVVNLTELLSGIQLYNGSVYHCNAGSEEGYAPGPGDTLSCPRHSADYDDPAWSFSLSELLRMVQLFNNGSFHPCPGGGTEDGFCTRS